MGDNALIRASGKEPTTPANTADVRGDQVDSIAKKLDDDIKTAKSAQEQTDIDNYINGRHGEGFSNIIDGKEAKAFADQGLSVDDEKDSEINQITVDHNDITLLKGQSEKIDGIDVTHTNKMTKKEKNDMKINSDNKVIIDLQHDQCQGKEITVTYDNLNNSYYLENINNKTNKIKISKIERTFSDIQPGNTIFTSDGSTPTSNGVYDKCYGPQLIIYNDPSDGFFFNNIKQVSVKDIYYDDKGQPITFKDGDKNKAWIFVTSLNTDGVGNNNHRGDGKEYLEKVKAENPDGTSADIEKIAGSTVTGPVDENTTKEFTRTVELVDGHRNGDYLRNYLRTNADDLKNQGWIWQENSSELTQTVTLHVKKTNDGYVYDNAYAFFKGLTLPPISENGTEKYPYIEIPDTKTAVRIREIPGVRVGTKTAVRIKISYSANNSSTSNPLDKTEVGVDEEKAPDTHDGWWYSDESNSSQNNYPDWDNKSEDNRYAFVGTVAIQYQPGMTITYGADDTVWGSHWACTQTQVVSSLNERVIIYDHIKDGVIPVTLSKDVTESITYKDLPKTPAEVTQVLHFTGKGYLDKVTGKWTDKDGKELKDQGLDKALEWTAKDGNGFNAVASPSKAGYYVDRVDVKVGDQQLDKDTDEYSAYTDGKDVKEVKGIDHNYADITITVHYAKYYYAGSDKETTTVTRTINYLDRKTGEKIPSNLIGDNPVEQTATLSRTKIVDHDGNVIGYGTVSEDGKSYKIDDSWHVDENHWSDLGSPDLSGYGYTDPVFENGTSAKEVAKVQVDGDTKDQTVNIYYDHTTTTVTPENPGKPGEPVDPDNPDGPKYPDGTDEYQVKRTGTQTIHYVGAGDKTPADNTQTFVFTREITFDNVTGKIIKETPWNADSHTFGTVKTPVIPGYHADKDVAGGATVTPDDLDKVITVTYAPDGNPGNPGDQGDTPTPEPTPEPEPTPNPTPDDQPDSETSSHEHFENAKAKGKLDKTNPKKVAAYKKERKIIKTKIAKQGHTEIAEPTEDKVIRENNVKVVSDSVENKAAEPKLPQTGEADNSIIGLLGMLLASFAAMFGFDSLHSHDKKHKN